jgi:uncharacterized Tic20 family protein
METTANKNTSTLLQLSALTQYFFPLGNYIFPVVIWSIKKDESEFVNYNGKQAINFQLSLLLYCLILMVIAVPIFLYSAFTNIDFSFNTDLDVVFNEFTIGEITTPIIIAITAASLAFILKVYEFILIFYAAVKNSNGEKFNFPLTINFIK